MIDFQVNLLQCVEHPTITSVLLESNKDINLTKSLLYNSPAATVVVKSGQNNFI